MSFDTHKSHIFNITLKISRLSKFRPKIRALMVIRFTLHINKQTTTHESTVLERFQFQRSSKKEVSTNFIGLAPWVGNMGYLAHSVLLTLSHKIMVFFMSYYKSLYWSSLYVQEYTGTCRLCHWSQRKKVNLFFQ